MWGGGGGIFTAGARLPAAADRAHAAPRAGRSRPTPGARGTSAFALLSASRRTGTRRRRRPLPAATPDRKAGTGGRRGAEGEERGARAAPAPPAPSRAERLPANGRRRPLPPLPSCAVTSASPGKRPGRAAEGGKRLLGGVGGAVAPEVTLPRGEGGWALRPRPGPTSSAAAAPLHPPSPPALGPASPQQHRRPPGAVLLRAGEGGSLCPEPFRRIGGAERRPSGLEGGCGGWVWVWSLPAGTTG